MPEENGDMKAGDLTAGRCPVREGTRAAVKLGRGYLRTLRKLRRDLRRCMRCDLFYGCPVLKAYNAAVENTVCEINEEWGSGG